MDKILYGDGFKPIALSEMDQVQLMNRNDTKYYFPADLLPELLEAISGNYYRLEIEGNSILPYETTYFDTDDNFFYTSHHNGKMNRYKVRRRRYVLTDTNFLEIKFKNNKGRTVKKRIQTTNANGTLATHEHQFIEENTPVETCNLRPALINNFQRITLVGNKFNERCTIDFDINFKCCNQKSQFDGLAVLELKTDGRAGDSVVKKILRDFRIKQGRFSKYCLGMAQLNPDVKVNQFKKSILKLEKMGA
jgi:hypothetical protein